MNCNINSSGVYDINSYNLTTNNATVLSTLNIGGYIFGKIFGGPKLIKISPNKTWSGAFGSLFLSQFAFLIYYLDPNFKVNTYIFIFQLFLSIVGQIGDILMSYVKRTYNIKDTSNFIPGHGGFLDRVDGLIWVFIFGYFLIT